MKHNTKLVLFTVTLIILLTGLTALSAADTNDTQTVTTTNHVQTTTQDTIEHTTSQIQTTDNKATIKEDKKVRTNTKNLKKANDITVNNSNYNRKDNKNLKTATKQVDVTNYTELTKAVNDVADDNEHDEFTINLMDGNYQLSNNDDSQWNKQASSNKTVIINANGHTLNTTYYELNIKNDYITINNAIIKHTTRIYGTTVFNNITICNPVYVIGELTLNNSLINTNIQTSGVLYIDDNTIIGNNASFDGYGQVNIENESKLLPYMSTYTGNNTIINATLNGQKINNGNLLLENCTLNCTLTNNANLTINNGCVFTDNFQLQGNGKLNISDINRIIPYISTFTGNVILENIVIDKIKTNQGNLTLRNCTVKSNINNYGNLTISDDTIFEGNVRISGNGPVYMNNSNRIYQGTNTYYGVHTFNQLSFNKNIYNWGNMTVNTSIVNASMYNSGDGSSITFINTILNSSVTNYGAKIIISNDTTFGEQFRYYGNNNIEIDDMDRILPYFEVYYGNITLKNITITKYKENQGNLTLKNCILNNTIYNDGLIIIDDDTVFAENAHISGNINTNRLNEILPYCSDRINVNGNNTFNNSTLNITYLGNMGTLLIYNSIINSEITNRGTLNINNCNLTKPIYNEGVLVIGDDVEFGENFVISGNGEVIINDSSRIIPYLRNYNGNYTFENITLDSNKINNGNITLKNCTIENTFINNGNLIVENTTLNSTIINNGNMTISDDTIIGTNTIINGNGKIIINDTNRIIHCFVRYNGSYTVNNITLKGFKENYGNLSLINSTISSRINNYGNLIFINCNITTKYSVLENRANMTFINCTVSNNNIDPDPDQIGSILNYGNIHINNTLFTNDNLTDITAIYSDGNISAYNSIFENYSKIISNPSREDVTTIINCTFKNNHNIYTDKSSGPSGGVLSAVNLYCDTCTFFNNSIEITNSYAIAGGCGGAIALKYTSNALINNSKFINNTAYNTSPWIIGGGCGGAIYVYSSKNNSYIKIHNSEFINNNAISPNNLKLPQYGSFGDESGRGGAIYTDIINTEIINNTFTNNYASIDAASIYILPKYYNNNTITIKNNRFINETSANETIFFKLYDSMYDEESKEVIISYFNTTKIIEGNVYDNCAISYNELKLTAPDKIYANTNITINRTAVLTHPEFYDDNLLNQTKFTYYIGHKPYMTTNKLNTQITVNDKNIILYAKPDISKNTTNILILKTTKQNKVIITSEDIDSYIFNEELIGIDEDSIIIFNGRFTINSKVNINTGNIIINGINASFTNTTFILNKDNITICNMKINNTNTSEYAIENIGDNNQIINNTIYQYNNNGKTAAIASEGSNVLIDNNNVTVYGPAYSITYGSGASIANTQGILTVGDNTRVTNNNIKVYNSTNSNSDLYSTIEGITAPGTSNNVLIAYNNVTVTGGRFNYGIDALGNVYYTIIRDNNINVIGHRYVDGIQIGNGATYSTITRNNITCTCYNTTIFTGDDEAMTFGIITTSMGGADSHNIIITDNNIQLNSSINYGMEIYTTTNTTISGNTIKANGIMSMGISFAHSPNNSVTNNTMILEGNSDTPINYIVEEIRPANTGIQVQQDSNNITITNNTIKVKDKAGNDKAINLENNINHAIIINNNLTTSKNTGDNAVTNTGTNNVITGNTAAILNTKITITPVNGKIGDTETITATTTNITDGSTITFTVDGTIIGNATVTNNTASIDYTLNNVGAHLLIVNYAGDADSSSSQVITLINIKPVETTVTVNPVNGKVGDTVTIIATTANINDGGTVTFTVDGTIIGNATVTNNTASIDYTLNNAGAQLLVISYVGDAGSSSSQAATLINIKPVETTVTVNPDTGVVTDAIVLNTVVTDANGNSVTSGVVNIIVNGNTYLFNIVNGTASATIPVTILKDGNNIISVIYNGNVNYEPSSITYYTNGTYYGPVYYVAVNGSSSNKGRTPETPWNYTYAFDTIQNSTYNNSLIYILNGNYMINNTVKFNNDLTIKVMSDNAVLDGNNNATNCFNIQNGAVSIENITFTRFTNTTILNRANNTIIIGNTFINNKGTNGGAINNYNTNNATITNNVFQNNTAKYGGAVYNRANNTTITNNTFTKNNVTLSSGAIYNLGANTKITNNQFTDNTAKTLGGAISNWDATSTIITGNQFNNNQANYGGAIYYRGTTLTLDNNTMTSNTALVSGGAVFVIGQNNNIINNDFTANKARSGAAINNLGTNINIISNTIQYNTAKTIGGAINNWNAINTTIESNIIHDNQAQYGAIYLRGSNITVESNNIYNNRVTSSGAAIFNIGTNNTINRNMIDSNIAKTYGGAINNYNAVNTRITDNNLTGNIASYGGAIYTSATNTTITGNNITDNTATSGSAIFDVKHKTTIFENNTVKNNTAHSGNETVNK